MKDGTSVEHEVQSKALDVLGFAVVTSSLRRADAGRCEAARAQVTRHICTTEPDCPPGIRAGRQIAVIFADFPL